MGIFSKIFRKNELKLHDEGAVLDDEVVQRSEDEKKTKQNTESSPFLTDDDSDVESE